MSLERSVQEMVIKATLEERKSKKSGEPYLCVVLKLTDTLEKVVFLEPAETELLKLTYSQHKAN